MKNKNWGLKFVAVDRRPDGGSYLWRKFHRLICDKDFPSSSALRLSPSPIFAVGRRPDGGFYGNFYFLKTPTISKRTYNDDLYFFLNAFYISPKYLCTKLIAIEPSPTAEAKRFIAPARTAKMPAQLVSNK